MRIKLHVKLIPGLFKNSILLILNLLFRCIPRNNKIWLYGGFGKKFIDNSKYLFINLNEFDKDIKHIWMTDSYEDQVFLESKGFLCCKRKSIKGILISIRAKVYIYSCYPNEVNNFAFSGGAFLFNLWHGVPIKNIEYDIGIGPLRKLYHPRGIIEHLEVFSFQPAFFRKSHAILCPLENFRTIFQGAFRVQDENVCMLPYPRTLPFSWDEKYLMNHVDKYDSTEMKNLILKCKEYKNVWIYMPTWRDADPNFINTAIPDFKKLDDICKKNKTLFLLKLHLATKINFDLKQFDSLVIVPNYFDIYPLLPFTTTLLTDYSSIFLDYQLLNKKIIFYPFDLEEYLLNSREMYFEYDNLAIGERVLCFEQLITLIDSGEGVLETCKPIKSNLVNGCIEISSFIKRNINKKLQC